MNILKYILLLVFSLKNKQQMLKGIIVKELLPMRQQSNWKWLEFENSRTFDGVEHIQFM